MCAIVGIMPAFRRARVEKFAQQPIWVKGFELHGLQHTSALEFGKAFQFIARKATQKIEYGWSVYR